MGSKEENTFAKSVSRTTGFSCHRNLPPAMARVGSFVQSFHPARLVSAACGSLFLRPTISGKALTRKWSAVAPSSITPLSNRAILSPVCFFPHFLEVLYFVRFLLSLRASSLSFSLSFVCVSDFKSIEWCISVCQYAYAYASNSVSQSLSFPIFLFLLFFLPLSLPLSK